MALDRVNSGPSARGFGTQSTTAGVDMHNKRIQAALSTQIVLQVTDDAGGSAPKFVVGAVQSLAITENRDIVEVYELGTDAIIRLVPRSATTYTLDIDRIVFDFQRLPQALQREYRHIHAQRRPFDIVVTDYNPYLMTAAGPQTPDSGTPAQAVTLTPPSTVNTTFGNCWFTRLNFTYRANDYLITESCSMKCEYVADDPNDAPATIKGPKDALESAAGVTVASSIMSAFDASLPT